MEKLFEEFSHKTLKQWNEKIISALKGNNYENLIWESPENIKKIMSLALSPLVNK